ncbi:MAG: CPBP family intramembrane metalloprotease [Clostridia bacterium]|nr:CPBP family intramembrane metalloprotease [Clostridia bacterium]
MKKKIYFSISAILQILASIYIIININSFIQSQINSITETYSMLPVDFQERMRAMLQNNGAIYFGVIFTIPIILNLIILKTALADNILKKKGIFMLFSIICLFTTGSTSVTILSILNFIVLLFLKRKNPEDYPTKEKTEMPTVERKKSSKKELVLGIVLLISYFFQLILDRIIPESMSINAVRVIAIVYYVFLLILSIIAFKDELLRNLKLFKDNSKAYTRYVVPRLCIMYIIFIVSRFITMMITKEGNSVNQSSIESLPLWISIIFGVFWAPIVEELVFRGTIRRFIKNNVLFILISSFIFGIMHTIGEPTMLNIFVMAIPYSILGGFLAYIYSKTDNLTNNILVHFINNAFSMLITSLLLFIII